MTARISASIFPLSWYRTPPWYLAPYVIWLGLIDYLAEHMRRADVEVLEEFRLDLSRRSHVIVRRVGIGVLLFGALVLLTAHVLGPATEVIAPFVPARLLLPGSVLIAVGAVFILAFAFGRALYKGLSRLYVRGLRVLERRASAAAQSVSRAPVGERNETDREDHDSPIERGAAP